MVQKYDLVVKDVPASLEKKLRKKMDLDGFGGKSYREYLEFLTRDVHLSDTVSERIQSNTREGLLETWVKNLGGNLKYIWEDATISDLVPQQAVDLDKAGKDSMVPIEGKSAIVVGRGPSLFEKKHLEMLAASDYSGTLVLTDGALISALEAGIKPDRYDLFLTVSVDGHKDLILKWYDHPLVDKYGPAIKACLCTTVSPNVAERLGKAGASRYWFHPIFDDERNIESFTKIDRIITSSPRHPDGAPAMQAGGHAGAAAWVVSWALLRRNPVALVGINLGYTSRTDLSGTYYWKTILEYCKGNVGMALRAYSRIYNPDIGEEAVLDSVFEHYRTGMLDMLQTTPPWFKTFNCTEGGALFGDGITTLPFAEFLKAHKA